MRASPAGRPVPLVSVIVTLAPGATLVALTVSTGGGVAVNETAFETPPPGAGVLTVTADWPTDAMSVAPIDARNCVLLTKVVARGAPFQRTTLAATKPVPLTVSVNAGLAAGALAGVSEAIAGTGLCATSTTTGALVAARV